MVYVRDLLPFSCKRLFVSYCVASAYRASGAAMQGVLDWLASENGQEPDDTHDSGLQDVVLEIEIAEEREKKLKLEREFARRRYQLAQQWKRDMQDRAAWEWARTVNALDLDPGRSFDAASRARAARLINNDTTLAARLLNRGTTLAAEEDEPEDEPDEAHEETPALPTPGGDDDKGKDEIEEKEDDAMTDESVSATPVLGSVAEEVGASIDVNKRRRTTEEGNFEEEVRSGLVTEMSDTDGWCIMTRDWVGENNSDEPYVPRGISLQPHPGYTGPTPW